MKWSTATEERSVDRWRSNSRRSELMALGVVDVPERARRMFPSLLRKSTRFLGLNEGPKPIS